MFSPRIQFVVITQCTCLDSESARLQGDLTVERENFTRKLKENRETIERLDSKLGELSQENWRISKENTQAIKRLTLEVCEKQKRLDEKDEQNAFLQNGVENDKEEKELLGIIPVKIKKIYPKKICLV